MSLERSYRRLLLAYPSRWWDERGEEVLGVLLEGAEARGARRPALGEVVDVVGHGLLARFGPAATLFDDRVRELTASLALASLSALSLLCLLFGEWWPWASSGPSAIAAVPGTPGPFLTAGGPVMVLALLPTVLVLLGAPRAARRVLVVVAASVLALPVVAPWLDVNRPAVWTLAGLLGFDLLALVAPVRRRWAHGMLTAALAASVVWCTVCGVDLGDDARNAFYYGPVVHDLDVAAPLAVGLVVLGAALLGRFLPAAVVGSTWLLVLAAQVAHQDPSYAAVLLAGVAALALLVVLHLHVACVLLHRTAPLDLRPSRG